MAAEAVGAAAAQRGVAPVVSAVDAGGELDLPRAPRRRPGRERPGHDRQGPHGGDLPPAEQGLRGPGVRRAPVGAAPRAGGPAAGRHADRVRRRGRRRDRRQRRVARPTRTRSSPTIGVAAVAAADGGTAARRWGPSHGDAAVTSTPRRPAPARAAGAAARPPRRDRRPADRRGRRARRRPVALRRRPRARRSTSSRSAGRRRRPARARRRPQPHLRRRPARRGRRLRRLGLGALAPADTQLPPRARAACASTGTALAVTIPERIGDLDPTGATVVFEVVIDDYAEVWVDGELPLALGDTGGQVVGGFNAPNRVVLTRDARPGERFQIAVFGINGPISASPRNYIWMRTATLDFYARERARVASARGRSSSSASRRPRRRSSGDGARSSRWPAASSSPRARCGAADGALLFCSPNTNAIYRWDPRGEVTVFRSKSGYTGTDIGRYHQPGLQRPDLRPRRAPGRCASTATAASCASSRTATSRCWPTATRAGA